MNCPLCGRSNPDGTDRCAGCGSSLTGDSIRPTRMTAPSVKPAEGGGPSTDESVEAPTVLSAKSRAGDREEGSLVTLDPGTRLGNRYEIVSVLGIGGMGVVYRAHDLTLEREVALKVIRPEMTEQAGVMERFRREILLASKITHKNILRIHDLGESDGLSYISMNYVEGETLKDVLRRDGALPAPRALPLAIQMCQALEAAHEAGVVHRDLKPQNILLDEYATPYIADFGLSRSLETGNTMTEKGTILGTIDYMSPEQARGETPDHRGDIYSFGLILYEMITGTLPFRSDNAFSVMMKRVHEDVPGARQVRSEVPVWLASVASRALKRDPDERYQSAAEMLADLESQQATRSWRGLLRPRTLLRAAGVLAVALLIVVGVLGGRSFFEPGERAAVAPRASLALLPFENATGDPSFDWIRTGLPELLRTDLQQAETLRLVGEDRVQGILDGLKVGDEGDFRPDTIRRISNLLGVDNVLTGSLLKAGDQFRLEASVQQTLGDSVSSGTPIRIEGKGEEALFTMVDELTDRIRDDLGVSAGWGEEDRGVTQLSTSSVEALRLHGEALALMRDGNQLEAAARLEGALAEDEGFAMARALLAETYDRLGYSDKAQAEADRAAQGLQEASPYEAARIQAVRARMHYDLDAAEQAYQALCDLTPNSAEAHFDLASVQEDNGKLQEALGSLRRVIDLDPKHANAHFALGRVNFKLGDTGEALNELNTTLTLQVETGNEEGRATVLNGLGTAYLGLNQYDDALRYYEEAYEIRKRIGDLYIPGSLR